MYTINNISDNKYKAFRDEKDHCFNFEVSTLTPYSKELQAYLIMHQYGMNLFIGNGKNQKDINNKINEYYSNNYDMMVQLLKLKSELIDAKSSREALNIDFKKYDLISSRVIEVIVSDLLNTAELELVK